MTGLYTPATGLMIYCCLLLLVYVMLFALFGSFALHVFILLCFELRNPRVWWKG